jgi:hypothetical protein
MATMRQRIEELGIRASLEWADANPHMDGMPAGSTHWKVTLRRKGGRRMTVYFSMGPAHTSEPEAAEVLDCLASDASGYDNARSFEDWCSEYGYDSDSRKAERTYKTIDRSAIGRTQRSVSLSARCVHRGRALAKPEARGGVTRSLLFRGLRTASVRRLGMCRRAARACRSAA